MKASEVIKSLSERIGIYGDLEVAFYDDGSDEELPVNDVFCTQEDNGRIVLTNIDGEKMFGLPRG